VDEGVKRWCSGETRQGRHRRGPRRGSNVPGPIRKSASWILFARLQEQMSGSYPTFRNTFRNTTSHGFSPFWGKNDPFLSDCGVQKAFQGDNAGQPAVHLLDTQGHFALEKHGRRPIANPDFREFFFWQS